MLSTYTVTLYSYTQLQSCVPSKICFSLLLSIQTDQNPCQYVTWIIINFIVTVRKLSDHCRKKKSKLDLCEGGSFSVSVEDRSWKHNLKLPHSQRLSFKKRIQTRSLRGRKLFNCDLQQWRSAKCLHLFVFYILFVCFFVLLNSYS